MFMNQIASFLVAAFRSVMGTLFTEIEMICQNIFTHKRQRHTGRWRETEADTASKLKAETSLFFVSRRLRKQKEKWKGGKMQSSKQSGERQCHIQSGGALYSKQQ